MAVLPSCEQGSVRRGFEVLFFIWLVMLACDMGAR